MTETLIAIHSVRNPAVRDAYGDLRPLSQSIFTEGLRRPITVWKDGTLISGSRRLRAHLLNGMLEQNRSGMLEQNRSMPAVFVDTIEDAAKQLTADATEDALPMTSIEKCRLWELLRELDAPAAVRRMHAARRRGVELRKETMAGKRKAARHAYSTDYVLDVLAPAFGISLSSASRLWALYMLARAAEQPERREAARQMLRDIDTGSRSIYAAYISLLGGNKGRLPRPKAAPPPSVEPERAAAQLAVWERSLPTMEGLVAGLVELGPPNPELNWDQVGPVWARLSTVRRSLEQIIKQMKEIGK